MITDSRPALQLQKEPADVLSLVQDVVRSMQSEAARKSVALHVTASTENMVLDLDARESAKCLRICCPTGSAIRRRVAP
jgi:hypothetical protein